MRHPGAKSVVWSGRAGDSVSLTPRGATMEPPHVTRHTFISDAGFKGVGEAMQVIDNHEIGSTLILLIKNQHREYENLI